jgi:hypothetical protein
MPINKKFFIWVAPGMDNNIAKRSSVDFILVSYRKAVEAVIACNGMGIYAVAAFPVPSVLVKDKKLI